MVHSETVPISCSQNIENSLNSQADMGGINPDTRLHAAQPREAPKELLPLNFHVEKRPALVSGKPPGNLPRCIYISLVRRNFIPAPDRRE